MAKSTESIEFSPRSHPTDPWDANRSSPKPPSSLRLMCSYGGQIVPRPHDKALCYVGGDTRIIVFDRHTSLSDLHQRLSKTLLHSESFSLKYQLPNENLDSLISVTADEDLENMVEEYDRLNTTDGGAKLGRLRLFVFPKPSSNMEQLLVENGSTKSEEWFLNALNGKASSSYVGAGDRGFTEASSVNCLLGLELDDVFAGKAVTAGKDSETQIDGSNFGGNGNGNWVVNQDVHSVPDSPMLETTSSFGSSSSSPFKANLPPIRVRMQENSRVAGLGIEDQFQQMSVGVVGNVISAVPQMEEVGGFMAAGEVSETLFPGSPVVIGGEYANHVLCEDERSGHGGYMKIQQIQSQVQFQLQPQPIPQFQQKQVFANDLPSPDSVSSEGGIKNPSSSRRQSIYQEPVTQIQSGNTMVNTSQADLETVDQDNSKLQMQPQVQESGYVLTGQYDLSNPQFHHPQQFVHSGTQYIPAGAMPTASYYPVYPSQQHHHPVLDQQRSVYYMPARRRPAYNLPVQQPRYTEVAPNASSSRPQTPPPAIMSPQAAYNQGLSASTSKHEIATGVYRTAAASAPQLVQVPSSQHQSQYVGFTHIHYPSQSMAPSSVSCSGYTYELAGPTHAQMYYTQHLPPHLDARYQTLTSSSAMVLPDGSAQLRTENNKL